MSIVKFKEKLFSYLDISMKINKQTLSLIVILTVIVFIVETLTILGLYSTAFEQQRSQLIATTQNQAKLIESIARFDEKFSTNDVEGGPAAATLLQVQGAHMNNNGFGKSGEFLFGKIENNNIIFLLPRRFKGVDEKNGQIKFLDVGGSFAEPIQLALEGKSGTIVANDYRGEQVLAAYAPVKTFNYGVVTKIDMKEIREPFIYIGIISIFVSIVLIAVGAFMFSRITGSMVKRIEGSAIRLNEAQRLAKVGSWELNLLTGNLVWSDEIFNIFEIDKKKFEATYEAFLKAIHPDDRDKVNQAYTDSLVSRKTYEISHRLQMSDGTIKYVHETCESFFDHAHKPTRSVGTVQDVTEIKLAELELEKHRAHLEDLVEARTKELHETQDELVRNERLATLGQLTATVSHELRNPLGAMRPSVYVIQKNSDKGNERLQKAIERVDRNIDRCDRIIDELLDFTRITDLQLESVLIDEWLGSVINDQVIPEGIKLEKDFDLNDVKVSIDSDRLRRVIINVLENACHAMMDDNQTLVSSKEPYLIINTGANNKNIEITFTDTGSGMSKEVLKKIFEPLFSTKGFGVGLGMPTVKQIMDQHDGSVEIKSEEGKGTIVTLLLPISENVKNSREATA